MNGCSLLNDVLEPVMRGASSSLAAAPYDASWADFDNDGDLDLITNGGVLYRNKGNDNNWLKLKIAGDASQGINAMGAEIRLSLPDRTLTRQVEGNTGQGNQNEVTALHFGLGGHSASVQMEARWGGGVTRSLTVLPNQVVDVAPLAGPHEVHSSGRNVEDTKESFVKAPPPGGLSRKGKSPKAVKKNPLPEPGANEGGASPDFHSPRAREMKFCERGQALEPRLQQHKPVGYLLSSEGKTPSRLTGQETRIVVY